MLLVQRIHHHIVDALRFQGIQLRTHRISTLIQLRGVDHCGLAFGLARHQTHQIAIGHWRYRMMAHARFGQQLIGDKKIALIHRTTVNRQRRRDHRLRFAQRRQQRISHRADIALLGAVKGGAIFEIETIAALLLQPLQRRQRLIDRLLRRA